MAWVVGLSDEQEIALLKKLGYEVRTDIAGITDFAKTDDPQDTDIPAAVFVDCDITDLLVTVEEGVVEEEPHVHSAECQHDQVVDAVLVREDVEQKPKPRIIVFVKGGNVQSIAGTEDMDVEMCDWDNAAVDEKENEKCHKLAAEVEELEDGAAVTSAGLQWIY